MRPPEFLPARKATTLCSPRPQRDLAAAAGSAPAPVGFKGRRAPVTPRRSENGRRPRGRTVRLLRVMQACSLAHSPTNRDGWICTTDAQGRRVYSALHYYCSPGCPTGTRRAHPSLMLGAAPSPRCPRSVCHVSENGSATGTCAPLPPIPTGCVAFYALAEQSGAGGAEETLARDRAAG